MHWEHIEAHWKHVTGRIRDKWVKLTNEDLAAINGNRELFESRIQERYGFARAHVRKEVDDWVRSQFSISLQCPDRRSKLATFRRETSVTAIRFTVTGLQGSVGKKAAS